MDTPTHNLSENNPLDPIPGPRSAADDMSDGDMACGDMADGELSQRLERPERGTAVLSVRGDIDVVTAPQLAEMLQHRLDSSLDRLVLNLSGVGFLGVAGVSVIFESDLRAQHNGTDLVIVTGGNRQVTSALTGVTGRRLLIQHDSSGELAHTHG